MSRLLSITFRGEQVDIEIVHDGGYEPDTNAHEVDWEFYGLTREQHEALAITEEEERAIYDQIYIFLEESYEGE